MTAALTALLRDGDGAPAALLCDLDGVLVDSHVAVERAWRAWAADRALDPAHVMARMPGRPTRETLAELLPGIDAAAEAARLDAIQTQDTAGCRPVPGAADLLARWPAERLAVVTSCGRALAEARLRAAGLPVPARMVTSDDVAAGKPDPEPYLRGAALLGVAPAACVVLEDAPAGVAAGVAAGARVVAVLTGHPAAALPGAVAAVRDLVAVAAGAPVAA